MSCSSSLCLEATNRGLILTPQLETRLRKMAHKKAVPIQEAREIERAKARTQVLERELAANRELGKDIAK